MASLENIEFLTLPNTRVIGREVTLSLRASAENPIPAFWDESIKNGIMDVLRALPLAVPDCTVGWMGDVENGSCKYILGVFAKEGTPVPEGMQKRDLPGCYVAKGSISGNLQNGDVYAHAHELTTSGVSANGYEPDYAQGWSAEVYPDNLSYYQDEGAIYYFLPCKSS